jgi:anoctamin-10
MGLCRVDLSPAGFRVQQGNVLPSQFCDSKEWIQSWSHKWFIDDSDFTRLRNHYGEKVTLYFAFTQFYCLSLIPISLMGILSHVFLPSCDWFYGVVLGFWTVFFKHAWERKQQDLAVQWGVKGFTRLVEQQRAAYVTEGERIDPITGERIGHFPMYGDISGLY